MPSTIELIGGAVKALTQRAISRRLGFLPSRYSGGSYAAGALSVRHAVAQTGSALDYENAAGDVLSNSVVAACVNAICQALPEAPILLEKRVGGNEFEPVHSHPVLDLLHNPNPYLSEAELWGVTTAFERTRGEAFWYFEYGPERTVPREIWFRAPEYVQVLSDTSRFISGYNITSESGAVVALDEGDVVHFRHQLSTVNPRAGWSPIQTGKRQIVGDNGTATYHSAILRNAGSASLIISLKDAAAAGEVTPGQIDEYVQLFKRKVVGEGSGAILGMDLPLDVHKVGFSPDEMALDKLLEYYEARICALMGVNRRVINLGSDPTYENSKVALNDFWERTIVPMRRRHASTLSSQLLPLFGLDPAQYRLRFDFSEVEALRENVDALHARWRETFAAGGIDLFTFQEKIGLKPDESLRGRFAKLSSLLEEMGGSAEIKDKDQARGKTTNNPHNTAGSFAPGGGRERGAQQGQSVAEIGGAGAIGMHFAQLGQAGEPGEGATPAKEAKLSFKTVAEAEKWAKDHEVNAKYDGNLTIGQQTNRVMNEALKRGLRIPGNVYFADFRNDDPAQSSPQGTQLVLNRKFKPWSKGMGAVQRKTLQMFNDGHWSTPHKDHIMRHEIGHMNRHSPYGFGNISDSDLKLIEETVSLRAGANADEFIAEMVAKLWDDPKGDKVHIRIMELYKQYGGKDMSKKSEGPETKSLRISMSQCAHCIHYQGGRGPDGNVKPAVCPAFPEGIPKEVLWGEFDHRRAYPGDNGVRFEIDPAKAEDYEREPLEDED